MSTNTNASNGAGNKAKKEIPTRLGVSENEINKDIANWAADRDAKGNIIPGTEGKTITFVYGAPYFKGDRMEISNDNPDGTTDTTTTGVTVIDPDEQGKTDLRIVEGPGIFIGTVEKEAKKDKESKEDKDVQKEDDDKIK